MSRRFFFLVISLLCSCTSPEKNTSGEDSTKDTSSYYLPKNSASVEKKNKADTVLINDMKFQPQEINVRKGDTIVWINNDLVAHCITEAHNMNWTSYQIPAGSSWKKAITETADYYCAIHKVMKGKIKVIDSATAALR
jgi:plastocyanin